MISSIVLAAGMSTRMGEPKALLEWEGQPLICYQVQQLQEAGVDEVVVVLGHRADEIQRQMRKLKCRVLMNSLHHKGKAGSLRIGAKGANRDADALVVLSVDQPRPASLIRELLAAHDKKEALITRPAHNGKGGHPIVLAGSLRNELLAATEENEGLRAVVRAHEAETKLVELGPACLIDLNTPEDVEAARAAAHHS